MNSWEMIKGSLTKGHTPNSVGYLIEVNKAAKLFVGLRNILGDFPVADEAFNADVEVGKALSKKEIVIFKEMFWTDENGIITLWYPDGDFCAEIHGNLGLGISAKEIVIFIVDALNHTKTKGEYPIGFDFWK